MYLSILGRQSDISIAELEALFSDVKKLSDSLATFNSTTPPDISRLGGSLKIAEKLPTNPLEYLSSLPDGKITLGISDYSTKSSAKSAQLEAMKLKKILTRHHRSVRVVANKSAVLSTATSLHNGLGGKNACKVELIKFNNTWHKVIGIQDIDAYSRRDQARPARDARVGMLPPKLAQILINLCGPLPQGSTILDPFCGTGVVFQEALLMGYTAYGTDLSDRMIKYTNKNLKWLAKAQDISFLGRSGGHDRGTRGAFPVTTGESDPVPKNKIFEPRLDQGDATSFQWSPPIDAVACESYLGQPMSKPPTEIKLKDQKQQCESIILGFLKNLAPQIKSDTPVTIAIPAWLTSDGTYSRLEILAFLDDLGYNVNNKSREGLLYYRKGQIVARDIIILRKK